MCHSHIYLLSLSIICYDLSVPHSLSFTITYHPSLSVMLTLSVIFHCLHFLIVYHPSLSVIPYFLSFPIVCYSSLPIILQCLSFPLSVIYHCLSCTFVFHLFHSVYQPPLSVSSLCLLFLTVCHPQCMSFPTVCHPPLSAIPPLSAVHQWMSFALCVIPHAPLSIISHYWEFPIVFHSQCLSYTMFHHPPLYDIHHSVSFCILCPQLSTIHPGLPFPIMSNFLTYPIVYHTHYLSFPIISCL